MIRMFLCATATAWALCSPVTSFAHQTTEEAPFSMGMQSVCKHVRSKHEVYIPDFTDQERWNLEAELHVNNITYRVYRFYWPASKIVALQTISRPFSEFGISEAFGPSKWTWQVGGTIYSLTMNGAVCVSNYAYDANGNAYTLERLIDALKRLFGNHI